MALPSLYAQILKLINVWRKSVEHWQLIEKIRNVLLHKNSKSILP